MRGEVVNEMVYRDPRGEQCCTACTDNCVYLIFKRATFARLLGGVYYKLHEIRWRFEVR